MGVGSRGHCRSSPALVATPGGRGPESRAGGDGRLGLLFPRADDSLGCFFGLCVVLL